MEEGIFEVVCDEVSRVGCKRMLMETGLVMANTFNRQGERDEADSDASWGE